MDQKNKGNSFWFLPFSDQQLRLLHWWRPGSPYHDCDMVIADGSVRSGKTIACICSFLLYSQTNYSGENFILAGKTIGALKRNVIGPMLQILNSWRWPHVYHRGGQDNSIEINGNTYYLYEANNESSQDKLQGLTAAGAYLDEAALMPRSFVEQAIARCSVAGAKMWLNCNPAGPGHYINKEYIKKAREKNICLLHFQMNDNLCLAEATKEKYRRMYTGVFYRRYVLGEWCAADGLIYSMFDSEIHVVPTVPRHYKQYYISVDYGTLNPFSMGLWGLCQGVWYRIREYYYNGREKGVQKTDEEYYKELEKLAARLPVESVVIDPSAASMIACIRKHGRYVVEEADNRVVAGIGLVASALHQRQILINDCCKDAIDEFGLYVWDEKASMDHGEDKPVKQNDHAMDDIRYFCMKALRWDGPGPLEMGGM